MGHTEVQDAAAAHDAWRERRRAAVTGPMGNLALVETRWFPADTSEAEADRLLEAERAAAGAGISVTPVRRLGLATGETEYGLRVWDADAPAIRAFEEIETFPYDPEWVIEAEFAPVDEARTVPFEHIRDAGGTRELVVPGDIVFERDGEQFRLSAFDDDGTLLLVFGDPTNGRADATGTYGAGRFLFVGRDRDGFGEAGAVTLDFNRAFVPPCGFSVQYNCPMPPPQNRLPWAIEAGERLPRFAPGFDIYSL